MMFYRVVLLGIILLLTHSLKSQTTDLLISEYVEGSSNNKYLEIYNGTGASVNLADYDIRIYSNGSATVSTTINLSGTLTNGNVYVIANSSAVVWGGTPDLSTGSLNFNGDDAVELFNSTLSNMVDLVGNIGCDPGSQWSNSGNSTQDNTIIRNATVCSGVTSDPTGNCPFPTLGTEWTQFAQDDVSDLGSHTNTCGAPCVADLEPTSNASAFSFDNLGCFTMDISWTNGNGSDRIVVASTSPIGGTPTDQTLYIASSTFGAGNTIAAGEFVVFNGTGNSVTVTGLNTSTRYYYAVFEYNGATPNCEENYLTTGVLLGDDTTTTCSCPEITGILVDACGGTIEGINEFFTFENGNNSLPIDSLRASFPNGGDYCNSGCGTQTWVTNPAYVASLNTTAGCPGLFVETDPIPAGGKVIVFTGSSPTYNFDFSGLCGTGPYYAVFANNTSTSGRFANYNATCTDRTLSVEFGNNCSDDATYSRCLLSNNDGDYVTFDPPGNATYQNDGCTPSAILPVELIQFEGEATPQGNYLTWMTASEINNDRFEVERSMDAISFEKVGIVGGSGNSSELLYYEFTDNTMPKGVNYYRLKQVDFNGAFDYSNVIAIENSSMNIEVFTNGKDLIVNNTTYANIEIFDVSGRKVASSILISGSTNLDLTSLNAGVYIYRIVSEGTIQSDKFFIK